MRAISLLTDFGLGDSFVGEMKAVLLDLAPGVPVVDVTHGIGPGRVREAAWMLSRVWSSFPSGTCHLAVVDPGVGGDRRALAATAGGHYFVGPDNGVLSTALADAAAGGAEPPEIREISLREIERPRRGTTFDGRDVFAPTAARLAAGLALGEVGPEVHDPVVEPSFGPIADGGGWRTEVVRVDRFGNLVTPVEEAFLRAKWGEEWRGVGVRLGDRVVAGVRIAYAEVPPGDLLLSIGGSGTLEISANRQNAKRILGLAPGDPIRLEPPPEDSGCSRPPDAPKKAENWPTEGDGE